MVQWIHDFEAKKVITNSYGVGNNEGTKALVNLFSHVIMNFFNSPYYFTISSNDYGFYKWSLVWGFWVGSLSTRRTAESDSRLSNYRTYINHIILGSSRNIGPIFPGLDIPKAEQILLLLLPLRLDMPIRKWVYNIPIKWEVPYSLWSIICILISKWDHNFWTPRGRVLSKSLICPRFPIKCKIKQYKIDPISELAT